MSSFHPTEPYSSSSCDVYLSESVMANKNNNNKGKKKVENGNRSNNSSNSNRAVKLSTDPQSVAARERRHRISDRFKILQSLVPGGSKMDTVSMLEEAIHYVKFLKTQIWLHQVMISSTAMDEDILRPLPPPPPPPQHSLYSSAPILTVPEQPAVTQAPSLPLYFFQADENHETMFTY